MILKTSQGLSIYFGGLVAGVELGATLEMDNYTGDVHTKKLKLISKLVNEKQRAQKILSEKGEFDTKDVTV